MKKSIYLLGLLLLAACANDDEPTGQQVQNTYPLTIEVTETPMTGEEMGSSRAAITTISTLTTFYLNYQYNSVYSGSGDEQSITNASGTWSGGSWPNSAVGPNYEVNWFAYTDGIFHFTDDNSHRAYINCVSDEFSSGQKDLLVATASGTYTGTKNGKLSFTFDHACSALRFWVKKSTNLNDYTLNISSIVLKNVIKVGKYFFKTGSWELGATSTDYTLYSGSATPLGSTNYIPMDGGTPSYLFLIPQTLTAWTPTSALGNTYLEITCTITKVSDSSNVFSGTAYIPFGTANEKPFLKGKKHDVKINIGMNSLYKVVNNTASLIIPQNS